MDNTGGMGFGQSFSSLDADIHRFGGGRGVLPIFAARLCPSRY